MRVVSKLVGAGAAVAVIALAGAYAFAQQGAGFGHGRMGMGPGMMGQGHGPMMGNVGDPSTRLAALKTELGIRPEQTAAWDAYAKVVTDTAVERRDHRANIDRDAIRAMTPAERLQHATAMQQQREAGSAKVKVAAETLLTTLDDAQRTKAQATLLGLASTGHGGGMRHGMMGGQGHGKRH